ncbi:Uncharacterized protein family UPF0029, Impact, N-terminal protein [Coriobacterium glomerans PW2]|uniref:Uncharacterized protein family UPF0029, Impact, N-terminal protein n=1 Tax=Coriobacterium glomerans (strain ATCC 49209 / DSM 20642 / JCM 10262 / PW2) TaxID=700015 RepID=F2NBT9_CORGP|nr:YigZ family protein [Coriobacterium glomerans]AEB06898.1 Uncharacterized protein family UPF0029, Impact, N-terminal protein [Coriobacterium glomerans PW2]
MEGYLTLRPGLEAAATLVERKSRFIAQLAHVEDELEASRYIARMRTRYPDARHQVSAWVLADGRERAGDDGEPSGTAGIPVLRVLRDAGLRDACCVTSRYFGGTLLGRGGLVRAYGTCAKRAVEAARAAGSIAEMVSVVRIVIKLSHAHRGRVIRLVKIMDGRISQIEYSDEVQLDARFRQTDADRFLRAIAEFGSGCCRVRVDDPRIAEF